MRKIIKLKNSKCPKCGEPLCKPRFREGFLLKCNYCGWRKSEKLTRFIK